MNLDPRTLTWEEYMECMDKNWRDWARKGKGYFLVPFTWCPGTPEEKRGYAFILVRLEVSG